MHYVPLGGVFTSICNIEPQLLCNLLHGAFPFEIYDFEIHTVYHVCQVAKSGMELIRLLQFRVL